MNRDVVLVAEDDQDMLDLLTHLVTNAGYHGVGAADGRSAANLMDAVEPVAMILDVEMPDMGGLELCRRARANPARHSVAIVIFSANTQPEAIAAGLAAGADRYLLKPLSPRYVIAELAAAITERSAA